jgi:hypothetical protein
MIEPQPKLGRLCCLLVLLALALFLPACSTFDDFTVLGYTTKSQFPRDIRTIRVPVFQNKTYLRGVEFELTEAVIKQIEQKTSWKVVQEGADVELVGIVMAMPKRVILPNRLNEVRQAELTLSVQIFLHDLRTGQPIPPGLGQEKLPEVPPLAPPQPNPDDPLAPIPIPAMPLPPVLVQRTATFVPELGESYATARQRVVNDMAEQIVSMLEVPW